MDDLISRQAAIDKADSLYKDTKNDECYMITGYNHAISDIRAILKSLPSAQPEKRTNKRTETHACDLISRRKAFEYFVTLWECIGTIMDRDEWEDVCMTTANEIPPAQPERKKGRWIETEGLDEEIRCTMCTNPMRSDRGCDGSC